MRNERMTQATEINIIDKVKAWAFPVLISILSIFMWHFYDQQQVMIDSLNLQNLNQVKQSGQQDLIIYRLNQIDLQIDELKKKTNYNQVQ